MLTQASPSEEMKWNHKRFWWSGRTIIGKDYDDTGNCYNETHYTAKTRLADCEDGWL
jgi:hypothetical protein